MTAIQGQSRVGEWEQRERDRETERGEVGDGRGPSNF